nr:cathepsin S-like isoform X1 [Nerophis lumbriciformis]
MRILCTVPFSGLLVLSCSPSSIKHMWLKWTLRDEKVNQNQTEAAFRRAVWEKNVEGVLRHNWDLLMGKQNFTLGLNHRADVTAEEVNRKLNVLKMEETLKPTNCTLQALTLPRSVDWRT